MLFKNCIIFWGRQWVAYISNQEKGYLAALKSLSSPFGVFARQSREPKQYHLIEGIESHLVNTEQPEQIAHIQTVSWGRFLHLLKTQ